MVISKKAANPRSADGSAPKGLVCIKATLSKEGVPIDPVITRHGDPILEQALLEALRTWRYTPATLNGEPIEVEMGFSIESR